MRNLIQIFKNIVKIFIFSKMIKFNDWNSFSSKKRFFFFKYVLKLNQIRNFLLPFQKWSNSIAKIRQNQAAELNFPIYFSILTQLSLDLAKPNLDKRSWTSEKISLLRNWNTLSFLHKAIAKKKKIHISRPNFSFWRQFFPGVYKTGIWIATRRF